MKIRVRNGLQFFFLFDTVKTLPKKEKEEEFKTPELNLFSG